jgi:methylated-DNA-protein-cysteine methyltransferase related protein
MTSSQADRERTLIHRLIRRIPVGCVATYGQIASLAGIPNKPRLVGQSLRTLAAEASLPWHRVVAAGGKIATRRGGVEGDTESLQKTLLEEEGVAFTARGTVVMKAHQWQPKRRPL